MSAINGDGYGSSHEWVLLGTQTHGPEDDNTFSEYRCADCRAYFRHFYRRDPDIFTVIKDWFIADQCGGPQ